MTKVKNYWIIVLISLIVITICYVYWSNYNTVSRIDDAKTSVIRLVDNSHTTKYSESAINIEVARYRMAASKPNENIKKTYLAFLTEWAKTDTLSKQKVPQFSTQLSAQYKTFLEENGFRKTNQFFAMLLIAAIIVIFLILAIYSNILRDAIGNGLSMSVENGNQERLTKSDGSTVPPPVLPPYSLARTQLAVWITIIGCVYSYAVLWDELPLTNINTTALLLMGISSGSFAAGVIIDTTEIQQGIPRHQDEFRSSNFFKDILSDKDGISIHRFQNLIWTIIAIFAYFYKYNNQPAAVPPALPVLDPTLLALTGISNATYLAMKTRENIGIAPLVPVCLRLDLQNIQEKDKIMALATGLSDAIIDVINPNGDISHAKSDPANPKTDFLISIELEKAYKIKIKWQGKIDDTTITLTGEATATIKPGEPKIITVPLTKV